MPDVPVHPHETKGNNLEWLEKLQLLHLFICLHYCSTQCRTLNIVYLKMQIITVIKMLCFCIWNAKKITLKKDHTVKMNLSMRTETILTQTTAISIGKGAQPVRATRGQQRPFISTPAN